MMKIKTKIKTKIEIKTQMQTGPGRRGGQRAEKRRREKEIWSLSRDLMCHPCRRQVSLSLVWYRVWPNPTCTVPDSPRWILHCSVSRTQDDIAGQMCAVRHRVSEYSGVEDVLEKKNVAGLSYPGLRYGGACETVRANRVGDRGVGVGRYM